MRYLKALNGCVRLDSIINKDVTKELNVFLSSQSYSIAGNFILRQCILAECNLLSTGINLIESKAQEDKQEDD